MINMTLLTLGIFLLIIVALLVIALVIKAVRTIALLGAVCFLILAIAVYWYLQVYV